MKNELITLGLTSREADAYLALIEFDEATASEIAKITREHRTNVYDSLNGLIKKGLIVYNNKSNVRYYRVASPHKIKEFITEKMEVAESILPGIVARLAKHEDKPAVEVYEGEEGFKSILSLLIRTGKTIYGIGATEEWGNRFTLRFQQYMNERLKKRIRGKLLFVEGTAPVEHEMNEIRFLPSDYAQPTTIAIFGDYVAQFMWTNPLVATVTKSKHLSASFKQYFDVLWSNAKER